MQFIKYWLIMMGIVAAAFGVCIALTFWVVYCIGHSVILLILSIIIVFLAFTAYGAYEITK